MAACALRSLWRTRLQRLLVAEAPATFRRRALASAPPVYNSGFQSEYSLDKLYPASPQKETGETKDRAKPDVPDIPMDRLSISYCRSSGPGGQNVNKVNTKAEVRFHLESADWIAEDVRQKMAVMHKNKVSKSGELIITSEVSRYQMRNLADCLQKLRVMIAEATVEPNVPSKETMDMIRKRVEKMNRERLRQKRIHSALKQSKQIDLD